LDDLQCGILIFFDESRAPSIYRQALLFDPVQQSIMPFQPQNEKWFHKATGGVAEEPIIHSREPTPAPGPSSGDQDVGANDRLIVTFDELLKELESCQNGVQFGTHLGLCHILLGHRGTPGVSAKQYNITVGDNLWIWLHDYYSMHGTAVALEGDGMRLCFRFWDL
jgi:hypothetical protein